MNEYNLFKPDLTCGDNDEPTTVEWFIAACWLVISTWLILDGVL